MSPDGISPSLQENLLICLVHKDKASQIIRNAVDRNLFSTQVFRTVVGRVYDYLDEYRQPPAEHLPDLLEPELNSPNGDASIYNDLVRAIDAQKDKIHEDYVLNQLERFVRGQTLKSSIILASEAVQAGDLDQAETVLEERSRPRMQVFRPGITLAEGLQIAYNREVRRDVLTTGIPQLDKSELGPGRGEFHLFIGPPKSGKCIGEDELVLLPDGRRKRIADVVADKDPAVMAFDESSGKLVRAEIAQHWDNGIKECVRLTTKSGRSIVVTPEHLFFTERGWSSVSNLVCKKDRVAIPISVPGLGKQQLDGFRLRLLGYLIADGGLTQKDCVSFTKHQDDVTTRKDFSECVEAMGDALTWHWENNSCFVVSKSKTHHSNNTKEWLIELGLQGKHSRDKFVPEIIFQQTDERIAEFLRALFTCDGSLSGTSKRPGIEYCSASSRLVYDVQHLLTRLGIFSRTSRQDVTFAGKVLPDYGFLVITGRRNVKKFLSVVGFSGRKEKRAFWRLVSLTKKAEDPLRPSRNPYGTRELSGQVLFDEVRSIERAGEIHTYDLTVDKYHTFVASNMIAHNSWWLVHITKRCLLHRYKVAYLTLELSEAQITQRVLQALFSLTKLKAAVQITRINADSLGRITGFGNDKLTDRPAIYDHGSKSVIEKKMSRIRGINQNLMVRQFPAGALTVAGVRSYLDMMDRVHHFVPDFLVIDYPDYMKIDPRNYRIDVGNIYNELRGIAVERDMGVVVASRSNREGAQAKLVTDIHAAEDFSRIYTADTVLTYTQTMQERQLGLARIFVSSSRVADRDRFVVLISQSYPIGQFALDSAEMSENYWGHLSQMSNEHQPIADGDETP